MIDDLIRAKLKAGEFNHLSIIASQVRGQPVFKALFRGTTSGGHAWAVDADPIKALEEVLTTRKRIEGVGGNAKKPSGDAGQQETSPPVRRRKSRSQA